MEVFRKHPIQGGCYYCLEKDCLESVHPEDAPSYFPFCDRHNKRAPAYHEYMAERMYVKKMSETVLSFNHN